MCLLALATGIVAGVGAWAFRMLIGLFHNVLFLGEFVFQYDANVHTPIGPWGAGIILAPVVGGLVVAFLVTRFAPEAKGHGVPEVMDAIHYHQGLIRPRVAIIKSVASAISIGSGGSVGREGPIVQIGSAFGSMVGQLFTMPTRQRVTLIAAGAGAGIAATFNAPLGGVAFAIELLLLSINATTVLLVSIATVTATHIGRVLLGVTPSFNIPALRMPEFHVEQSWELLLFVPLGALMGIASAIFVAGLYWAEDRFEALPGNYYSRHVLGTLCLGLMIYVLMQTTGHYYVQGVGYATIVDILTDLLSDPLFLLMLFGLKLLATWLSLGSGASGGVFSPALFLGATMGSAFGHVAHILIPGLEIALPAFAVAGMAAAIGGSTGAVLTAIVMITEMTQDHNVILPLILTVTTAYAVRKVILSESIYTLKLTRRGHSVPEGLQAATFSCKKAKDVMCKQFRIVEAAVPLTVDDKVTIVTSIGVITGVLASNRNSGTKREIDASTDLIPYVSVAPHESFLAAVRAMNESKVEVVLVSKDPASKRADEIVGVLTKQEMASLVREHAELL